MLWKKFAKDWLYFSRKERLGIYIMSALITLLWVLPVFFSTESDPIRPLNITAVQIDSLEHVLIKREKKEIKNFKQFAVKNKTEYTGYKEFNYPVAKKVEIIDINKADSIDFEKLPGIGEKLSARMVKYRERLGGYYKIEQLKEIYGMQDSNFIKFKHLIKVQTDFKPHQISINRASYSELRQHPYLSHLFVKSVLAYIKMHGFISGEDELFKIGSISQDEVMRVLPYLDFAQ
jgi:DNA uptake protein ComE-like DNA-binding protein